VAVDGCSARRSLPIRSTPITPVARDRHVVLWSDKNETFCYLLCKREVKVEFKEIGSRIDASVLQCKAMTA
jgi:hypothetical protein